MINLDSILKNRDITWLTKVCTVNAMVFLVIMYRCENEHQRIDAFQLWSWRRLESPLDSKEIKPVVLNEINPEYSLGGLMLKLNSNTLAI